MSFGLVGFFLLVGILLLALVWSLKRPTKTHGMSVSDLEHLGAPHTTFLPQIRQSLSRSDQQYLSTRGSTALSKRVQKDRKTISLLYVSALKNDFDRLLHLAAVITSLSPEVVAMQELERLALMSRFLLRYQMVRIKVAMGSEAVGALTELSDMVSGLAVRMETAVKELGARAAIAAELGSALDGRGMGVS